MAWPATPGCPMPAGCPPEKLGPILVAIMSGVGSAIHCVDVDGRGEYYCMRFRRVDGSDEQPWEGTEVLLRREVCGRLRRGMVVRSGDGKRDRQGSGKRNETKEVCAYLQRIDNESCDLIGA